jgi:hypothetical protein
VSTIIAVTTMIRFPGFDLRYFAESGAVYTYFPDGSTSGRLPDAEDAFHGQRLGISPGYHRLAHELARHLIGEFVLRKPDQNQRGSFVVAKDASSVARSGRGLDLRTVSPLVRQLCDREDQLAMALVHESFEAYDLLRGDVKPWDDSPLIEIATRYNLDHLCEILRWLLEVPVGATVDLREAAW